MNPGRSFGRDACTAKRMDILAEKHHDDSQLTIDDDENNTQRTKCSGCGEFQYANLSNAIGKSGVTLYVCQTKTFLFKPRHN